MGRAGRTQNGYCYRLYSSEQYEKMPKYTTAEILRFPMTEICLNAQILANDNVSIEEFLSKALQPPTPRGIKQAIDLLQQIDAIDLNEKITNLGYRLANMPIECQLGKSVIYAALMRCLDPVITIVIIKSANKDLFRLPLNKTSATKIYEIKKRFADNSLSDDFMMLNVFDQWQNQKQNAGKFCRDNMINASNMQTIAGLKRLIMNHLKSIGVTCDSSGLCGVKYLNENSK